MQDNVLRHAAFDRIVHWVTALAVLVLLGTAFLPILGIEFAWVAIHWWSGLVLILAVVAHIVRAVLMKPLASVWIGRRDLADAAAIARSVIGRGQLPALRPGKYSFAQKFIHFAFGVVVLTACVTGALMLVKVDTPWWRRNPYWLSDETWGVVYVLHGYSALILITMVMVHIYFALRPEKRMFLRAMIGGTITRREYERTHDPHRWRVDA